MKKGLKILLTCLAFASLLVCLGVLVMAMRGHWREDEWLVGRTIISGPVTTVPDGVKTEKGSATTAWDVNINSGAGSVRIEFKDVVRQCITRMGGGIVSGISAAGKCPLWSFHQVGRSAPQYIPPYDPPGDVETTFTNGLTEVTHNPPWEKRFEFGGIILGVCNEVPPEPTIIDDDEYTTYDTTYGWALVFPIWYPLILAGIFPAVFLGQMVRHRVPTPQPINNGAMG